MAIPETSGSGEPERKVHHPSGQPSGGSPAASARTRVRALFEQQADRAADQLGSVAQALHRAAQQLDTENQGSAARFADGAAQRVEDMAGLLRNGSVDDAMAQVQGFARRQPEVFVGGAFALGFLFSRFIKSSGEGQAFYPAPVRARYGTSAPPSPATSRTGPGTGPGGNPGAEGHGGAFAYNIPGATRPQEARP
jgi:hypothetical protein